MCYVPLKRHCGDLAELRKEEWLDFVEMVRKLESALKASFKAAMFNWSCWMNYAYQVDPPNPHVHWHFMPRYDHSIDVGGVVFVDSEFGHPIDGSKVHEVSDELKKEIAGKIKSCL